MIIWYLSLGFFFGCPAVMIIWYLSLGFVFGCPAVNIMRYLSLGFFFRMPYNNNQVVMPRDNYQVEVYCVKSGSNVFK